MGWGTTTNEDDHTPTSCRRLMKTEIRLINQKECSNHLKIFNKDLTSFKHGGLCRDINICSYDIKHVKGICSGDSGGPLICNGTQVGVVSWSPTGNECAHEHVPDVFSRIDINVRWIKEIMVNARGVKRLIDKSFDELFELPM